MIHGDMSVTDFAVAMWNNKVKVGLLLVAVVFGPGLYAEWDRKRATERLEAERQAIDTEASVAGMMLASAWKACSQIGIVNDMDRCAAFNPRLLQEQAAPVLARSAVDQRATYYSNCQRFYAATYCGQLLQRALQLSVAQSKD